MATLFNRLIIIVFIALFSACSPEPVTDEVVQEEPVNEVEAEVKAMEEPLNIPSVVDEVVDANEAPMDMSEPEPEPQPAIPEPEIIEDVEPELIAENNETAPEPLEEVVVADTNTSDEVTAEAEDMNATEPPEEVVVEAPPFKAYVEQIGVLKIGIEESAVRLMMKDPIIKYFPLTSPDRIVIDFKDVRYLEPQEKTIESPIVSKIATASHDNYNRVVIYLKETREFTISKNRGDWLIDFK